MRNQEEIGKSAYSVYKNNWLFEVLKVEPNFISFLPGIFSIWSGMWDSSKVERIIKKQYKKIEDNHTNRFKNK
jgi:hypothetical protein